MFVLGISNKNYQKERTVVFVMLIFRMWQQPYVTEIKRIIKFQYFKLHMLYGETVASRKLKCMDNKCTPTTHMAIRNTSIVVYYKPD